MMVLISGLSINCSGLANPCPTKLPFRIQSYNGIRFNDYNTVQLRPGMISRQKIPYIFANYSGNKHALSVGRNSQQLSFEDGVPEETFLISLVKQAIWALRSLFVFLVEQPSQLKYIEWPSFQSTLKTATLTLVLVALLIVALSSVDSVLCYFLALVLRRTP
ncbi:hypothetical protein HS088_TW07G01363 [Tripterygium wilfordii]|uniref:Uncharacterized protein n=1 Tax=Tripterygium wilfordii TaxID=458696 RepID=A0A7J7DHD3_TRIWF|nr:uncharacterized protein LOC120002838 [Tripterygium wilfordii]KAF5745770.1 hypothetical protein HS088_TW07G01363 [Tripterygium wilfordii]